MKTPTTSLRRSLHITLLVFSILSSLTLTALADLVDDGGIISSTATDAFEDDNAAAVASVLPLDGTVQERNFGEAGDVDWVAFTVDAGRTYTFSALPTEGSPAQPRLALFSAEDTATALAESRPSLGGGAMILWTAPADGTYYLQVSEAGDNGDATYTYQLKGERFIGLGLTLRLSL